MLTGCSPCVRPCCSAAARRSASCCRPNRCYRGSDGALCRVLSAKTTTSSLEVLHKTFAAAALQAVVLGPACNCTAVGSCITKTHNNGMRMIGGLYICFVCGEKNRNDAFHSTHEWRSYSMASTQVATGTASSGLVHVARLRLGVSR